MKKCLITLCLLVVATVTATSQVKSDVVIEKGERWWGGFTAQGSSMPFLKATPKYDFATQNFNNQASSFFVSNYGRYIFSGEPIKWQFDGDSFLIDAPTEKVTAIKVGKNLREAFVIASNKHFKANGLMPPAAFFESAQWNTWIELLYDQNQAGIEQYAADIIGNGFQAGVLMIDDNWQRYYGNFDFRSEKFPDPKAMTDKLHAMGFKVMVWVCPFVSPDSEVYRELAQKGYLVREEGSQMPEIVRWWNGASAVYDLLNPDAMAHLQQQLEQVQQKYGIDGFKFDAGDVQFYDARTSNQQAVAWQELAAKFPFNELRSSWNGGGQAAVQRLGDKDYSWQALNMLIPDMIAGSMLGYPFLCPDMIGGGQYGSFEGVDRSKLDQTLIVRWAQASALMPMMQFSVAPWKVLDNAKLKLVRQAAELHSKFAPYILTLAAEAAKSGEPIVRPMEYQFPKQGFSDCADQFMLGSKYLVAPILNANGKRVVRLPRGTWTDDNGKRLRGPIVVEINAPLSRLPYFELK